MRIIMCAAVLLWSTIAQSDEANLHVVSAWAPSTFKLAVNGAAYVSAHNMSGKDVVVTGLSVDTSIANKVELHETIVKDEMARMRQVTMPVSILDGDGLNMQPGGKHIMLLGLKKPLTEGTEFPLTVHFEGATQQVISVKVKAQADQTDHSHHH
jgi:periplasmic copper chaperone A